MWVSQARSLAKQPDSTRNEITKYQWESIGGNTVLYNMYNIAWRNTLLYNMYVQRVIFCYGVALSQCYFLLLWSHVIPISDLRRCIVSSILRGLIEINRKLN